MCFCAHVWLFIKLLSQCSMVPWKLKLTNYTIKLLHHSPIFMKLGAFFFLSLSIQAFLQHFLTWYKYKHSCHIPDRKLKWWGCPPSYLLPKDTWWWDRWCYRDKRNTNAKRCGLQNLRLELLIRKIQQNVQAGISGEKSAGEPAEVKSIKQNYEQ